MTEGRNSHEYIECHHKSLRDDLHVIQSELKSKKNLLELIKDKT